MTDLYLIWSHEHGAWWGPDRCGYVQRVSDAGRYPRADAVQICAEAIPGTSTRMGALPDLPIRFEDISLMVQHYIETFGEREEPWL